MVFVVRWVRRIARAGRTVHKAGKVAHGAGKAIHRASKHIDLDGLWKREGGKTHESKQAARSSLGPTTITEDLESQDPQRRKTAYRRIAELGEGGRPYLQQLLTAEQPAVRRWAAESLAHLRTLESPAKVEQPAPDEVELAPAAPAPRPTPAPSPAPTSPAPAPSPEQEAEAPAAAPPVEDGEAPRPPATLVTGRALGEEVRALARTSRLDAEYAERLQELRAHRRRFPVRIARLEATRSFDASPSLRDGTTLLGTLEDSDVPVAVRVPRAGEESDSLAGSARQIEGEFVAWDPVYDRAIFEGILVG